MRVIRQILRPCTSFLLILLIAGTSLRAHAATDNVVVELPQTVELALIIAAMSPLDLEGSTLARRGEYFEAVESHFSEHSDHPVFDALGERFNLPRLAGNAADFSLDEDALLRETDTSGSLWRDSDGDLFRRYLPLIADFARVSDFQSFYSEQRSYYQKGFDRMRQRFDGQSMTAWLEANFSARPGAMQIIVSPLIGGLNWTTLYKPQVRMFLPTPAVTAEEDTTTAEKVLASYSIFTELDHSYVNPVSARMIDEVNVAFADLDIWSRKKSPARSYPTPELQFNEYMTWAAFLLYAFDQVDGEEWDKINKDIVDFMVRRRGFQAFGAFSEEAVRLYADKTMTAEAVMMKMIDWAGMQGADK